MADVTRASKSKNQQPYCYNSITFTQVHARGVLRGLARQHPGFHQQVEGRWQERQTAVERETKGDFEEESHSRNNLSSQAGQPVETAWLPSGCGSLWLLLWRGKLLSIDHP